MSETDSEMVVSPQRFQALATKLGALEDDLQEERDRRADLEATVDEQAETISRLQQRVAELDDRTDMLSLVEDADQADGQQRSAALIQHLVRAAQRREQRDEPPRQAVDRAEAEQALHYPDVDRTAIYHDMQRAERLFGDEAVLWYDDGELKINLEAAEDDAAFTRSARSE
jgi:chromosome segregation ATPase